MAYYDEGDLAARVGGMTTLTDLTSGSDPVAMASLIDDVCDEADGYFRAGGYTVPLDPTLVPSVKGTLLDVANYKAMSRGSREPVQKDIDAYTFAIQRLRDIAAGKFTLESDPIVANEGAFEIVSDCSRLSHEDLSGW